LPVALGR